MLGRKVGIDIGSHNTRLYVKGEGVVAIEPTAIADDRTLEQFLGRLVTRAVGRQRIFKPDLVFAVSEVLPGQQRRRLLEMAGAAGARSSYLIDVPLAAAMGCGMATSRPQGHLVVDLGGGKTELGVVARESLVVSRCVGGGAGALVRAIAGEVGDRQGVMVGLPAAETVLAGLVSAVSTEERSTMVGAWRDGQGVRVRVTSADLRGLVAGYLEPIAAALREMLDETPASLRADIRLEGMVLTGGAAHLESIDRYLAGASGIDATVARDAQLCTIRGVALAIDNLDVIKRNVAYIR